jgi:AraC-like DNA-binding protein/CheY-like chemotaxis protein
MAVVTVFHEQDIDCLNLWGTGAEQEMIPFEKASSVLKELDLLTVAVVLCDRNVERGLWLLETIKGRFPATPVVFITATSSEEVVTRAFKGGARDYFRIPCDPSLVVNSLERIIDLKCGERSRTRIDSRYGDVDAPVTLPLPDRLASAISLMERNIVGTLCLDDLAKAGYMSKYHFCRAFKRYLGVSPLQYYTSRRIEKAKEHLREPECTISQAALKTGFNDQSDFCRLFKKVTGITPRSYRKSLKP